MRETAKSRVLNQFIFVVPSIVFFAVFVIIPFLFSLGTSFSQWNGVSNDFRWAGFGNYIRAFGDGDFKSSLAYTLKNTVVVTLLANGIGLLLALALTSKIRGIAFFRSALIVPNILSGIVLGFIWKFIFMKGLPAAGAALGSELLQISWLGRPGAAFWSIVIVSVWQMSGYVMLIYIAGILSVPADIIESAYLDGASNFQLIRCVILPHLKPSFLICFFWTISKNLVQFDLPFSLTGGGPYKSTETLAINIYQEAFVNNNYGYGASKAILFFFVVVLVSLLQAWLNRKKEE